MSPRPGARSFASVSVEHGLQPVLKSEVGGCTHQHPPLLAVDAAVHQRHLHDVAQEHLRFGAALLHEAVEELWPHAQRQLHVVPHHAPALRAQLQQLALRGRHLAVGGGDGGHHVQQALPLLDVHHRVLGLRRVVMATHALLRRGLAWREGPEPRVLGRVPRLERARRREHPIPLTGGQRRAAVFAVRGGAVRQRRVALWAPVRGHAVGGIRLRAVLARQREDVALGHGGQGAGPLAGGTHAHARAPANLHVRHVLALWVHLERTHVRGAHGALQEHAAEPLASQALQLRFQPLHGVRPGHLGQRLRVAAALRVNPLPEQQRRAVLQHLQVERRVRLTCLHQPVHRLVVRRVLDALRDFGQRPVVVTRVHHRAAELAAIGRATVERRAAVGALALEQVRADARLRPRLAHEGPDLREGLAGDLARGLGGLRVAEGHGHVGVSHPRVDTDVDAVEPLALVQADELEVQHLEVGDGVPHALRAHELQLHAEALEGGVRQEGPHRRHVPEEPRLLQLHEQPLRLVEHRLQLESGVLQLQGVHPALHVTLGHLGALIRLALLQGLPGGGVRVQVAAVQPVYDAANAEQRQHDLGVAEDQAEELVDDPERDAVPVAAAAATTVAGRGAGVVLAATSASQGFERKQERHVGDGGQPGGPPGESVRDGAQRRGHVPPC
ncbi:hypothetical protein MXAN_3755 [Myxococcus xanthus DK 1622]|uniref:Uncharacterized protein n=1 Tax=Myxococcus xanthus (strain DK1622) TaxID=246197 RepID=Q1D5Y6_MYXXD|nr:hypothetical protein MXAN_3755 [Myxococcus xanthus DK 1622]